MRLKPNWIKALWTAARAWLRRATNNVEVELHWHSSGKYATRRLVYSKPGKFRDDLTLYCISQEVTPVGKRNSTSFEFPDWCQRKRNSSWNKNPQLSPLFSSYDTCTKKKFLTISLRNANILLNSLTLPSSTTTKQKKRTQHHCWGVWYRKTPLLVQSLAIHLEYFFCICYKLHHERLTHREFGRFYRAQTCSHHECLLLHRSSSTWRRSKIVHE